MDRIEHILNEQGLSKADFATLMGTSRQNVNALLKNPTRAKLEQIASALKVPIWQLFVSPEEVVSQEFVAFFYHKGRTHTPTTMGEMMDVLQEWNEIEFHKICQDRGLAHLCNSYNDDHKVKEIVAILRELLGFNPCSQNEK